MHTIIGIIGSLSQSVIIFRVVLIAIAMLILLIILGNNQFSAFKEDKLVKVNLIVKPKEKLSLIILLLFNRCILSLNKDSITLYQKG